MRSEEHRGLYWKTRAVTSKGLYKLAASAQEENVNPSNTIRQRAPASCRPIAE